MMSGPVAGDSVSAQSVIDIPTDVITVVYKVYHTMLMKVDSMVYLFITLMRIGSCLALGWEEIPSANGKLSSDEGTGMQDLDSGEILIVPSPLQY